jgi:predicted dehydrogenase
MGRQARLGIIGLGVMGKDLMKEASKHPQAEIAALCDIDPAALETAAAMVEGKPRRFTDHASLLRDGGTDAVVVAVPQFAHAEVTVAALEAGYPTFCEKPMALSVKQCHQMIEASRRTGKPLMVGQVLRYIGPYRYILERVRSGELGTAVAMRTIRTMGRWEEPWVRPWRLKYAQCGGQLPEVNVHEIDLMCCMLGSATAVSAAGGHLVNDQIDYEDFMTGHIQFRNGGVGSVTSANCDFLGKHGGEVYCQRGSIYYDSVTSEVRIAKEGGGKEVLQYQEIHPEWENGVYREMREFVEACLGEREVAIPGEDGLRAVEIAEAMYLSARNGGRRVDLPLPRT